MLRVERAVFLLLQGSELEAAVPCAAVLLQSKVQAVSSCCSAWIAMVSLVGLLLAELLR